LAKCVNHKSLAQRGLIDSWPTTGRTTWPLMMSCSSSERQRRDVLSKSEVVSVGHCGQRGQTETGRKWWREFKQLAILVHEPAAALPSASKRTHSPSSNLSRGSGMQCWWWWLYRAEEMLPLALALALQRADDPIAIQMNILPCSCFR